MIPNLRKRFTAYVVFQGAEHRRWWRIFTRRGWRHCYLILPARPPGASMWCKPASIVINPWVSCVRVDYLDTPPEQLAADLIRDGVTCVISLPIDQKFTGQYVPRGLLTCVSMIKAVIGCNDWTVVTPEHLARWMLRQGGKLIGETPNVIDFRRPESGQEGAASAAKGAASAGSDDPEADG